MNNNIFTFWEPQEKIPAYLRLCMKTWEKYLPDFRIISLNYNNLNEYLPQDTIKKIIYKRMPLAQQADCIRACLLHLHGGYWFDNDTILTSDKIIRDLQDKECSFIGNSKNNDSINIGFIYAKQNSSIIKKWADEIPSRVSSYKKYRKYKLFYQLFAYQAHKTRKNWSYFGNDIVDILIKNSRKEDFFILDKNEINPMLEMDYQEPDPVKRYKRFYFEKNDYKKSISKNKGLICLHNSWTPKEFKQMTEEEFLKSNCTLANILKEILNL